jgi:hypothetical protein
MRQNRHSWKNRPNFVEPVSSYSLSLRGSRECVKLKCSHVIMTYFNYILPDFKTRFEMDRFLNLILNRSCFQQHVSVKNVFENNLRLRFYIKNGDLKLLNYGIFFSSYYPYNVSQNAILMNAFICSRLFNYVNYCLVTECSSVHCTYFYNILNLSDHSARHRFSFRAKNPSIICLRWFFRPLQVYCGRHDMAMMPFSWEIQCCHNVFVSYPLMLSSWEIQCSHIFLLVIHWCHFHGKYNVATIFC